MAKSKPDSSSSSASSKTEFKVLESFDLNDVAITGFETTYSEAVKPQVKHGARVDFGSKTYANTLKVQFDNPVRMNVANASQIKKTVELTQFLAMKACRDTQERDGIIPGIADDVFNVTNMSKYPHINKENVVQPGKELEWILERFAELGAEIPEGLIAAPAPEGANPVSAPVAETATAPLAAAPAPAAPPTEQAAPAETVRRPSVPTTEA